MIPPHLQSIFKSLSWCSVSDDWLPSFLPWKHRDSPPKILQRPSPPAMMKWWLILQLDKKRPWFSVGLISWICRSHTNTQKVGFFGVAVFLTGENAKQPHGILFCKASACEDWALKMTQDVPLKCWRKKSRGLPRREGHVDAVNSTMICSRLVFLPSARDIPLHLPETDIKIITNMSKWVGSFFANFLDKVQITSF